MSQNDPNKKRRKFLRIKGYDYTQPGDYFITVCVKNHSNLFGYIEEQRLMLNNYGRIVIDVWHTIPQHFPNVYLDRFIVMPDHIHGIITILPSDVGVRHASPLPDRTFGPKSGSLGTIIGSFKSAVTKLINQKRGVTGESIWQRDYYEHIIRNDKELEKIRSYIESNPALWHKNENADKVFSWWKD